MRLQRSAVAWDASAPQNEIADRTYPRSLSLQLELMLASGGDERIWPDPLTGRNRYGTSVVPAPHEIWFSSSTASTTSLAGYRAAAEALAALMGSPSLPVHDWFDAIRARILRSFGIAGHGSNPHRLRHRSRTDDACGRTRAARRAAHQYADRPTRDGQRRSSSSSRQAFSRLGTTSRHGRSRAPIEVCSGTDIDVVSVALRHADGRRRPCAEVDNEVLARSALVARAAAAYPRYFEDRALRPQPRRRPHAS